MIKKRNKITTEFNGITQGIIWWEVDTNTKPIISMDLLDKLGLQLIQRRSRSSSRTPHRCRQRYLRQSCRHKSQKRRYSQNCDSVELNKQIVKKTMQLRLLVELLDRISMKISANRKTSLFVSTIDLDYAFANVKPMVEIELYKDTAKPCVAVIVAFQTKIDKALNYQTPAWQDDTIIVTRSTAADHESELTQILSKLEEHGYKASERKSKLFQHSTEWWGYIIDAEGVRPKRSRTEAVSNISVPKTVREVRSFLGSVQYLAKTIRNLSVKSEPIRRLLKKRSKWSWRNEQQNAFDQIKSDILNITRLKHYDENAPTILSTDTSTKGLGATLWQENENGRLPVAVASRFLNNAVRSYVTNDSELLAGKWATEHFKQYLLGRLFTIEADHIVLVPVFNRHGMNKEYSARFTRWQMCLLPHDFEHEYVVGSHMRITDYLNRDPTFEAPEPEEKMLNNNRPTINSDH